MKNKYYQFIKNENSTDLYIYGDITSQPYFEGEISASTIIEELNNIDSDELNVYISSYGGECKEGLAIYSALKRHKAKVTTYCDGFDHTHSKSSGALYSLIKTILFLLIFLHQFQNSS